MSPADFAARVARIEEFDRASPLAYRIYALWWALLGYVVLGLAAFIAVAVLGALVAFAIKHPNAGTVKLCLLVGVPAGWLAWNVAKSLHVRFDPPDGLPLERSAAPEMRDEIERLRVEVGAPRLHGVRIHGEVGAAMWRTPRLGVLGLTRNELILGLPLLRSLSEDEARAVIAHSLSRIAGRQGRLAAWMWRIRQTWARIHGQNQQGDGGPKLLRWFLAWYAPRFAAASFPLASSHERAADQAAICAVGADPFVRALARMEILGRAAREGFWDTLDRRALRRDALPPGFLAPLQAALDAPAQAKRWLREALEARSGQPDIQPPLSERLRDSQAAIAGQLRGGGLPPKPGRSAARAWLGQCETALAAELDRHWLEQVAPRWAERGLDGQRLAAARDRLAALAQPTAAQRWDLAQMLLQLDGDDAARPQLEAVLAADRQHAQAAFQLGRILLAADDGRGEILLRHAAGIEPAARIPAAALLAAWHGRHGRSEEALAWEGRVYERSQEEGAARAERAGLPERKRLKPVLLEAGELELLRAALAAQASAGVAHVCAAEPRHEPERRWLVLAVQVQVPWWKPRSEEADALLAQTIASDLVRLGDVSVVLRRGKTAGLAKAVAKVAGAPIRPPAQ